MIKDFRSRWCDEDGASAMVVVLSMFVLLGAAALAVDAGSLWMTKRNFVADTDAAALAGARAASDEATCADKTNEATIEARAYLVHNQGGTVSGTPNVAVDCAADTVTVDFTGQAPMTFAGVLGFSQLDVFSSSTANFDNRPLSLLRPLATCISNPIVDLADENADEVYVPFSGAKDDLSSGCGSPSGNWGWLCFDSNCGTSDPGSCDDDPKGTGGYLRCGFNPGLNLRTAPIVLPPPYLGPYLLDDEDCYEGGIEEDWCVTNPGSKAPLGNGAEGSAIYEAMEERVFPILLIDAYDPDKNGRTEAHPKALLWVSFDGYCIGNGKNGTREWDGDSPTTACPGKSFAFELTPLHVQWSMTDPLPGFILDDVPAALRICGIDHDPDGGTRC